MKRTLARVLLPLAAAAAFTGLAGGVAGAATLTPSDAPIWALPGLDVGSLLGPVGQPLELLAPVYGLITLIS